MNREIKFRGLSVNGDWYFGLLSKSQGVNGHQPPKGCYICNSKGMPWAYQVRPETVGQFTGLKDKNGKEIYEGDIIEYNRIMYKTDKKTSKEVIFHDGAFKLKESVTLYIVCVPLAQFQPEIIGNIHENPELIK